MRRKGFNYDQHLEIGRKLRAVREEMMTIMVEVSNGLGSSKRATVLSRQCLKNLESLRSELDNELCRNFPDREFRGVYYGRSKSTS
jgi:hypothetical protein